MDDPIWGRLNDDEKPLLAVLQGGKAEEQGPRAKQDSKKAPLWTETEHAWTEADLPRRPWVVGGYLQRKTVTLLAGRGGVSKSSLVLAWASALCLGQNLGRFAAPVGDGRLLKCLVFSVEDTHDEQRLRLAATLRQFGVQPSALFGKLMLAGPEGSGVLLSRGERTGALVATELMAALSDKITSFEPDVLFVDPLGELHSEDENSNSAMREVLAALRAVANEKDLAVCVLHHLTKGSAVGEDLEATADKIRGGGSIVNAARLAFVLRTMSEDDAKANDTEPGQRHRFARLDAVKANYSALSGEPVWFERVTHTLENGEDVGALHPWTPPKAERPNLEKLATLAEAIGRGTPDGPYSDRFSVEPRSVRHLFARNGVGPRCENDTLARLMSDHGIIRQLFKSSTRNKAYGLRTTAGMPKADWVDT